MLRKWLETASKPSWEDVVIIHRTVDKINMAREVRNIFFILQGLSITRRMNRGRKWRNKYIKFINQPVRDIHMHFATSNAGTHPMNIPETSDLQKSSHNTASNSTSQVTSTTQQLTVGTTSGRHGSEPTVISRSSRNGKISVKVQQLQKSFKDFLSKAHDRVNQMDKNKLSSALKMSISEKRKEILDLKDLLPCFDSKGGSIWYQFCPHFNFLDCSLLEQVIALTKDSKLQSDMQLYRIQLEKYTVQASVLSCVKHFPGSKTR